MAELAVQLGSDAIRKEAEKYGFNSTFTMPLESEASVYPRGLDAPQTALSGFGQGQVRATPLQMALVSAGIANGGVVMNPRMIDQVVGPDLSVQQSFDNTQRGSALDPTLAAQITQMMVSSVQDGAASNARIDGVQVAGKTGTAENGSNDPYTLWFTASHRPTTRRSPWRSWSRTAADRASPAAATTSPLPSQRRSWRRC